MIQCVICLVVLGAISICLYLSQQYILGDNSDFIHVNVNSKEILFETDEEFLSVALDMSFMRRFFHEFSVSDWKKLQQLSSLLSPAYLRLGGTDADRTIFNLNDSANQYVQENASNESIPPLGNITITAKDWIKLNKFAKSSRLNLIIDLNVLLRRNSHWNSTNAETLIKFSEKNGFSLSFQLGNEPNYFRHVFNKSLTGTQLAADYFELRKLLNSTKAYQKSKLIGPEVTRPKNLKSSSLQFLEEFLENGNIVDVVSWHQYYLNGHTATLEDFINPETFDLLPPQINAISKVVRQHSATTPIWISETSSAYGGGAPKLSNRFVASFLWVDKLGVAARMNMSVVIRQSLFKDHYSLINQDFTPTPDFWISVLFKNLVGNRVLSVKLRGDKVPNLLRIYGHCLLSNSSLDGSIVLYGMNLSDQRELLMPSGINFVYSVYSYIFKPDLNNLKSATVLMNGHRLACNQTVVQDMLKRAQKVKVPFIIPPKAIGFWVLKETTESRCSRRESRYFR